MEIVICTINHSQYLYDTLVPFKNNINIDLSKCKLYINIDPFPDNENYEQVIETAKEFCSNIEYRIGTDYSAAAGFLWALNIIENDVFFVLGGGKTLIKQIDIDYMKNKLNEDINSVQISVLNKNNKYLDYLALTPCLCKTNWFKKVYLKHAVSHLEIEYQLRELALLDNKKCLSYKISDLTNEYYPKHIKSYDYKDNWNCIYWNRCNDKEIEALIKTYGEWHKNIIQNFISNFNENNPIHKNFYLKTLDKDWIYRWTGYFGFISKDNESYYKRHCYKSSNYLCNKYSNLSISQINLLKN